jgi:hypothetical protein
MALGMSPQPHLFEGPILPDLAEAAGGGGALGSVAGFFVGSLLSAFRPIKLLDWAGYGAGVIATFGVWLVLWSRLWP